MNMLILITGHCAMTQRVDCLLPEKLQKFFLTTSVMAYIFFETDILCKHISPFPKEMPSLSHPTAHCVFYYLSNSHLQGAYFFHVTGTGLLKQTCHGIAESERRAIWVTRSLPCAREGGIQGNRTVNRLLEMPQPFGDKARDETQITRDLHLRTLHIILCLDDDYS